MIYTEERLYEIKSIIQLADDVHIHGVAVITLKKTGTVYTIPVNLYYAAVNEMNREQEKVFRKENL